MTKRKLQKFSIEFCEPASQLFLMVFPMVTSYIIVVQYQSRKLTFVQYFWIDYRPCLVFTSFYIHFCVCVYSSLQFDPMYRFMVLDTELFHLHKGTLSCYPLIVRFYPPPHSCTLAPANLFSISVALSFWECYINGIK